MQSNDICAAKRLPSGPGLKRRRAADQAVEWRSQASDVLSVSREARLSAPSDAEAQKSSKTPQLLRFWCARIRSYLSCYYVLDSSRWTRR